MLLITANDIFIFRDISVELTKHCHTDFSLWIAKIFSKILLCTVYLKFQSSVLWQLLSFAEKYNVKICSFGYRLGPSVITLKEPNTMFLVKGSSTLSMRFFMTLFLWIQNAKISQTLVQWQKNDKSSIDQKFLSKNDLRY